MSGSHEIGSLNYPIALKFDRHLGTADEVPVKSTSEFSRYKSRGF